MPAAVQLNAAWAASRSPAATAPHDCVIARIDNGQNQRDVLHRLRASTASRLCRRAGCTQRHSAWLEARGRVGRVMTCFPAEPGLLDRSNSNPRGPAPPNLPKRCRSWFGVRSGAMLTTTESSERYRRSNADARLIRAAPLTSPRALTPEAAA